MAGRALRLQWRPFAFALPLALVTAHGAVQERRGWLLRLEDGDGRVGWGEAAPLDQQPEALAAARGLCQTGLAQLGGLQPRGSLEQQLPLLPPPLAFALGMALAELDGLGSEASGGWRPPPPSALLLPAGEAAVPALERALAAANGAPLTVKWKVAAAEDSQERQLLRQLLERLPANGRLRLDANGGWDRATAAGWAAALAEEPRLEWLEQPLDPADGEGLLALVARVPVALDESLRLCPGLGQSGWPGWQVRRPAAEADPRPLLQALVAGTPRLMISTALETGIGRRLVQHLAALQAEGPTPTAPGLAPGWRPAGDLFSSDPRAVWAAADQEGQP